MTYTSTRGNSKPVSAAEAILKGIADDGGLYAPLEIPKFTLPLNKLTDMKYTDLAFEVLKLWFTDFTDDELRYCIEAAYSKGFDNELVAPVIHAGESYFLELFHGQTLAFKDMALSILPHLLVTAKNKLGEQRKTVILTATSGDTGKAALSGFANVGGTEVIVFYPKGGVSEVQRLQMVTQEGENAHVISVDGNFDDAQTGVKNIFNDADFNRELNDKGVILSSANSINIGRLVPQIVYYFYAYGQMLKNGAIEDGEWLGFSVPTGNFGNILAAWYACEMGLPIGNLICASNENNVLTDFFNSHEYNTNRKFILTSSPSMDILVSSNLERLLFETSGQDSAMICDLYDNLRTKGVFDGFETGLDESGITAGYATEEEVNFAIKLMCDKGYVMDTHTAVAYAVCQKLCSGGKNVIVSTASPYKFGASVLEAITGNNHADFSPDALFADLHAASGVEIPSVIKDISRLPVLHKTHCKKEELKEAVRNIL